MPILPKNARPLTDTSECLTDNEEGRIFSAPFCVLPGLGHKMFLNLQKTGVFGTQGHMGHKNNDYTNKNKKNTKVFYFF